MNEENIKENKREFFKNLTRDQLMFGKVFSLIEEYQESHPDLEFNFMIQKSKEDPKVFIHNLKTNIKEGDIFIEEESNDSYGKGILSLNEERLSNELKNLLIGKKSGEFSFSLIFEYFKLFKDFTLELLRQTNELNVIEMDERVMESIKNQSSKILLALKKVLHSHLENRVKNLSQEFKKYESQEHVFSFHLKGELEAYTRILNELIDGYLTLTKEK